MKTTDIKDIEAITGAKVIAATKETSSFNSDFVLLDDNGTIRQAFTVRDINGKMCVDVFAAEYDTIAAALAYLNMTDEELAQNIEYINPENNTPSTMNANETIMQTIKINIEQTANGYEFTNGNISVASIREYKRGTFSLTAARKPFGAVDSLAMAFEVLGDKIEALFAALGLNVEFVNA